jgi:hypothetical protein
MTSAFASFSRRSLFLFSLQLGLSQAGCGDPCDGAPPPPPFLCSAYVTVFADLPADQQPTIARVGTTITGTCDPGGSAGEYWCSIQAGPWRAGATFDVTVEAPGAAPQTVTFVFGAPGSSACFTCPVANSVPPVDLRSGAADLGLPPIAS